MEEYRVLLVDDEEELREGIRRKIDWAGLGFVLAGTAGNGVDALELAEQLRPDVVLTDIKMPYMDGLELCGRLKPLLPAAKLVVFSGFDEFEYARQAVGMNVFEYILKPVTAPELSGVLTRLREELDRERSERRDIEAIRRRYDESLPILRELFYTRLLDGRIPPDQVRDRAARYELQLPPGWWAAALVRADVPGRDGEAGRDELVLLSIQGFFQSRFAMEGCALHTVLYNDTVALLVRLEEEGRVYAFTEELGRLCRLAVPLLGMTLFAGVGRPCPGPARLHQSVEGAAAAADYRVLLGAEQVFYIGDLEPNRSAWLTLDEADQRALSAAVKLGAREQVAQLVHRQVERVREARLSLPQSRMFFLEILTTLARMAQAGGADVEEIFGAGFTGMVSITDFRSLDELEEWLLGRALRLWELLGRQRTDSAWKAVEGAKNYIAGHYDDPNLSVEALCDQLHLSPAYFSTLFKRETQKSFTAYVTEVRMERAARLLRETDEKTYLIAQRTGYADPNYFSFVFKRHFGMPPSKFRAEGQD